MLIRRAGINPALYEHVERKGFATLGTPTSEDELNSRLRELAAEVRATRQSFANDFRRRRMVERLVARGTPSASRERVDE